MKYCIIVPDGMADRPLARLAGRTPLEAARKPNMDAMAAAGQVGMAQFVPAKMAPSSDVANLALLGYDPRRCYTGRGPLEAASLGITLAPNDIAFRCNFITVDSQGCIEDYCAGEIPSKEAAVLLQAVQEAFGGGDFTFHPGISFKNIMVYHGNGNMKPTCYPPHDHMGEPYEKHLPTGPGSEILRDMIRKSYELLDGHEINAVRIDLGENPANMIWPWSPGAAPKLDRFSDRMHVSGAVISAVDLIKGIAALIGLDSIEVPGATGSYDTDYAAKGRFAIEALNKYDFVFVHIEATDTAGHAADVQQKIKAIEEIDKHIVGPIHQALKQHGKYRLLVTPDHPTPIEKRTHVPDPVPFVICGSGIETASALPFAESSTETTPLRFEEGHKLIEYLLSPQ